MRPNGYMPIHFGPVMKTYFSYCPHHSTNKTTALVAAQQQRQLIRIQHNKIKHYHLVVVKKTQYQTQKLYNNNVIVRDIVSSLYNSNVSKVTVVTISLYHICSL